MPALHRVIRILGMLAGTVLLGACSSSPARVPVSNLSDDPLCRQVSQKWPQTVAGENRRNTAPQDARTAAWGSPAITARCGVSSPGPTTAPCIEVNGFDWVAFSEENRVRFITYGRQPALEVVVPSQSGVSLPATVLPEFDSVVSLLPQGEHHCI